MKTITEVPAPTSPAHTPGPWDVEPKGSRHFVDGADGLTVAYLDRAGVRERSEIEANARLIAAAPTLLEALEATEAKLTQAARAFYCAGSAKALREAFEGWRTTSESAREAIAKARG